MIADTEELLFRIERVLDLAPKFVLELEDCDGKMSFVQVCEWLPKHDPVDILIGLQLCMTSGTVARTTDTPPLFYLAPRGEDQ